MVATANDPTCLDPAILKRPGRFGQSCNSGIPARIHAASITSDSAPYSPESSLRSLSSKLKGSLSPNCEKLTFSVRSRHLSMDGK